LGVEPLQRLHDQTVRPIAVKATKGAWYRDWRVVSLDGSTLEAADESANDQAFGRPGASRGQSAYPQIRFVSLVENGTHVLFGSQMGGYGRRTGVGQRSAALAEARYAVLGGSRHFQLRTVEPSPGYRRRSALEKEEEHRVACEKRFPDGSYLSRIYPTPADRRRVMNGVLVRVIDYRLVGVAGAEPIYRLVTTILDPGKAPAPELAALYHERWRLRRPWMN